MIERRALLARAVAPDDARLAAHVGTRRATELLEAEIALAEQRALALDCGLECLEADVDSARALVARKPPSVWRPARPPAWCG